jgi:hypothetical protein
MQKLLRSLVNSTLYRARLLIIVKTPVTLLAGTCSYAWALSITDQDAPSVI